MDADRAFARVDQAGDEFAHRAGAVVIGDVDRLDRRAGRLDRQYIRDRSQDRAIVQFELRAKAMNACHWINSFCPGERGRTSRGGWKPTDKDQPGSLSHISPATA